MQQPTRGPKTLLGAPTHLYGGPCKTAQRSDCDWTAVRFKKGHSVMSPAGIDAVALPLDRADRKMLADMVREFVRAEIASLTSHPEDPVGPDAVDDVLTRLGELGVLTGDDEPGAGIWDLPDEPASCQLSLQLLGQVAESSPAIGYAVHLRAVAGWLDRVAVSAGVISLVSFDRLGAGAGRATGRSLAGIPLCDNDIAALENAWGSCGSESLQLLVGTNMWQHTWSPRWHRDSGWQLVRTPRVGLSCTPLSHAHGLDELAYRLCHDRTGDSDAVLGAGFVVDAFALHGMGLLAIATATAQRAVTRARNYARTRRQGGGLIGGHDAVAQLLSRSQQTLATAQALLDDLANLPAGLGRLHQVWQARAQLHPLLSAAGSDALQVFGGLGYMRDVGAEKDARDLNSLRCLGGSPFELTLRCAALDEAAGVTL